MKSCIAKAALMTVTFCLANTVAGQDLELMNHTRLQVAHAIDADKLTLTFKNTYDKPITSIAFAIGTVNHQLADKKPLAPGATKEYVQRLNVPLPTKRESERPSSATVFAVVFADGTTDGDAKQSAHMTDFMTGQIAFADAALPLVQKALDGDDANLRSRVKQLASEIELLAEPQPVTSSRFMSRGFHYARQEALSALVRMAPANDTTDVRRHMRPRLDHLKKELERKPTLLPGRASAGR